MSKHEDMVIDFSLNLDNISVGGDWSETLGEIMRVEIKCEIRAIARKIVREDPRVKAAVKKAMMAGLESLTKGDKK